jgi:hypothetical protein
MNYQLMSFTQEGGQPSNSRGSTYSAICKRLEAYNRIVPNTPTYINTQGRNALVELQQAIDKNKSSKHNKIILFNKAGYNEGKTAQKEAVAALEKEMKRDLDIAKISFLIDEYSGQGQYLLMNSMQGWKNLLGGAKYKITFTDSGTSNMEVRGQGTLMINRSKFDFFNNGLAAIQRDVKADVKFMSILVHEYHHHLTRRKTPMYYDEFVAHWKQYDIGGHFLNNAQRVKHINNRLLDDPNGYTLRLRVTQEKTKIISKIEDTGKFWTGYKDNLG